MPLVATILDYGRFGPHDVEMVSRALSAYGVGLVGLIVVKILAPGFYAKQDIKTPVKIAIVVLVFTQACNYVFVPLFAHAGLTLAIGLAACLNGVLLYFGLVRRGIYRPSAGWGKFLLQLLGACLVIAGVLLWLRQSFDWVSLRHTPIVRLSLLGASLVAVGALYFGMLWAMGFKYTFFRRRVS